MLPAVLVLVLIVVGLLAIPLELRLRVAWPEVSPASSEVRWAYGLLRRTISAPKYQGDLPETTNESSAHGSKARTGSDSPNLFRAIRDADFRQRLLHFFEDIWRALGKQNLRIHARLGLDDPAATGQLWSVLGPVSALLASKRNATVVIEPEFSQPGFAIDGSGVIRLIPLQLIWLVLGLLLSPAVWRGCRAMYRRS